VIQVMVVIWSNYLREGVEGGWSGEGSKILDCEYCRVNEYRINTYQACRAQIGSISETRTIAPWPLRAAQQPLPTYTYTYIHKYIYIQIHAKLSVIFIDYLPSAGSMVCWYISTLWWSGLAELLYSSTHCILRLV